MAQVNSRVVDSATTGSTDLVAFTLCSVDSVLGLGYPVATPVATESQPAGAGPVLDLAIFSIAIPAGPV